jgi:hypothetical protein
VAPSDSAVVVGKASQAEAYRTFEEWPGVLDPVDVTYEAIVKIDKLFKGHPSRS